VFQESEIVDLMLVVFLMPMLTIGIRSVKIAGKRWFIASYWAIVCGFILTVVEGYAATVLMNDLEHIAYAVGGIFLAVAANALLRDVRDQDATS
jgi:hypothetical protein